MEKKIIEVKLVSRLSKNGKTYKCIIAVDEDGNEHILQFVNKR